MTFPRPTRSSRDLPSTRTAKLVLESLEDRSTPAVTSFLGTVLTIDLDDVNEALTVSNDGTNISLTSTASITGAGSTFSTAGLTGIIVADGGDLAGQAITFAGSESFALSDGLTSTGVETVTFNREVTATGSSSVSVTAPRNIVVKANLTGGSGGLTLTANQEESAPAGNFVGIDVDGATVTTTGSGEVLLVGLGGNTGGHNYGVVVRNAGRVSSGGIGNVTVEGTGGDGSSNKTNNIGVLVSGADSTITSGGGNVTVTGTGGSRGEDGNTGVQVNAAGTITSGGSGEVNVNGTGGSTSFGFNQGVYVVDTNSKITSGGGNVIVTGQGGPTGGDNVGVRVTSSLITSGGGTVTVTGTGGSGNLGANPGVRLLTGTITSGGGDVRVIGLGGGSGAGNVDPGVFIIGGIVTAGGSGTVTIEGTGGGATGGNQNYGVDFQSLGLPESIIGSNGGAINITGIGRNSSEAVRLLGSIVSGGNAPITITADSVNITTSGTINSGTGTTTIRTRTAGTQINLGGADVLSGSPLTLGLTSDELNQITAGTLVIGRNDIASGTVTVSSAVALSNALALEVITARDIVVNANLTGGSGGLTLSANQQATPSGGNFNGVLVNGATVTTTGGGDVLLQGRGGDSGSENDGVRVQSGGVVTGSGTVTVEGEGGSSGGTNNEGVYVVNANSTITSEGGNVQVTGTGGSGVETGGGGHYGVLVSIGGTITSGGLGTVTVEGAGGSGGFGNAGVFVIEGNSTITSGGGNVAVIGTGGTGNEGSQVGVHVIFDGQITSGGSGTVTVMGTGGSGNGTGNQGVRVSEGQSTITSGGSGSVTVTGVGGDGNGNGNIGVSVSAMITSGGAGEVTVHGTGGSGSGASNYGVIVVVTNKRITSGGGAVNVTASATGNTEALRLAINGGIASGNNADITVTADSIGILSGGLIDAGTGTTTIRTRTAGTLIDLGGADVLSGSPLTLGLTSDELNQIAADTLVIGDANAGTITVSAGIAPAGTANLNLITGAALVDANATGTDITVANLSVVAPNGIGASGDSIELNVDTLTANSSSANGDQFLTEADLLTIATGDLNAGTGTITLGGGTFLTATGGDMLSPLVVGSAATLGGVGMTAGVNVLAGGTVAPGNSPGILDSGSVEFAAGSTFAVEVNGPTPGTDYDRLRVTGTVNLGGATLNATGTIASQPGQATVLIDNNGSDPVVGTFAGLAELSTLTINGITFAITYKGGDGNDVALIKVPTTADTVRPTVRISPPSVTAVRVGGVVRYTITYSDANFASSSLSAANIRLNRTGTANGTIVVTGTGRTRTVTIRNIRGNGTLSISILAGTATDTAGNKAVAAGPSEAFRVLPLALATRPR